MTKVEREQDELRERLGIHSEQYKAKDREVKNLTSERKAVIWEWKVTTVKAKKEMLSILCRLTTNRSVPTAQFITDNGKDVSSQKQKAVILVRLYRDVSNLKFQKQERNAEGA